MLVIFFVIVIAFVLPFNTLNRKSKREKLTKDAAEEACNDFGSELLSHVEATKPRLLQDIDYRKILNDGDTAWVGGFVEFSSPIVYRGCYERKKNGFVVFDPVEYESQNIYSCINYCQNDTKFRHFSTELIGITHNTCLCLKKTDLNRLRPVADSRCDSECSKFDIDSCGGEGVISVYRLYKNSTLLWDKNDDNQGQCIYSKLKDSGKRIKVYSTSCVETSAKASGYFCQHGTESQLDRTCSFRDKTGRYCLVKGSSSRQMAKEGCLAHNGVLVDINSEQHIMTLMQYDLYYWLGIQRAYTVTRTRIALSTACLAVTRVNDTLYLDPDNCDKKKFFLCVPTATATTTDKVRTLERQNSNKLKPVTTETVSSAGSIDISYTTVTKGGITKKKRPATQKNTPTLAISSAKLKSTLVSKLETIDTDDSTKMFSTLISRANYVTRQETTYSFVNKLTSSFRMPEGTQDNRNESYNSNFTTNDKVQLKEDVSRHISEQWTIGSNKENFHTDDLDKSAGPTVPTILLAVGIAILVLTVIIIVIVVRKKCHHDDRRSNPKLKKSPKKHLEPYCVVDDDSVIHVQEGLLGKSADFPTSYPTNIPSTQSVVYDVPEDIVQVTKSLKPEREGILTTSFKPVKERQFKHEKGVESENNQYDTLKFNNQSAKGRDETYGTGGVRLNMYDHGIACQNSTSNSENTNYYVLERLEQ